jgi:hypothetical protein
MIIFTIVLWILGAGLITKADAMNSRAPSDWGDFCLALVAWPFVAVLVCTCKHNCAMPGDRPDYHY